MVVGVVLLDLEGCEIGFNVSVVEAHSTKMIWYQWFLLILAPRKKSLLTLSKRQSFWVRCLVSRELHESPFRLWATKGLSVWMAHPYSFGFNLGCKSSAFDFDGWVSWRIFSKACLKGGNLEAFLTIQSSWTADGLEDDAAILWKGKGLDCALQAWLVFEWVKREKEHKHWDGCSHLSSGPAISLAIVFV